MQDFFCTDPAKMHYSELAERADFFKHKKTPEERQQERLRLEKDKLEAFFVWLEKVQPGTLPKSALGKAVNYALNHREGLSIYLNDGNAALSNNICERAIRSFTIGQELAIFGLAERSGQRCRLQRG